MPAHQLRQILSASKTSCGDWDHSHVKVCKWNLLFSYCFIAVCMYRFVMIRLDYNGTNGDCFYETSLRLRLFLEKSLRHNGFCLYPFCGSDFVENRSHSR